ncbi:lateral tail fiber protein with fibronectin type III domain [Escherichia phage RudolfGeigy]|uniref:Lateral tail fiber protein with fibronectin type III domain n=2 Tax=Vequintavirus TaxID=1914852 RepID=A0AAE7VWP8_9CAUD|nr:lateral tail fiber protein with fibronectin type III domain [Escherichia phage AlexBoehm]QXV82551.1 lateral tail fiber protein with fibronectin type III domain [Escherichia phage MaxBurger]QXV84109.1 lateral tail fiber protein with fibronectin type III domain [Escherichia phage RudolfGeigy]
MPIAMIDNIVASARSSSYDWNASKAALADSLNTVTTRTLDKIFEGNKSYRSQQDRQKLLRSSAAPCSVVYGKTRTSGLLAFLEQDSDRTLHCAIVLANHPLEGIEDILIDGNPISSYGDLVSWELHNDRKTSDPFMGTHCPSWSPDMIGRGISWLRASFRFDPNKFPFGLPNVTLVKVGKKCYDPRISKEVYTNNAALVILDYLRTYLKCPDETINWESFKEAANICDEAVKNADGTSERRYTINGEFDMDEAPASIMAEMLKACGADLSYVAGKYGLLVGAYYGPATMTLSEDCVCGEVKIYPEASFDKRSNTITGRFTSPTKGYSETDFPSVFVPEWIEKDGERKIIDIDYRFVTSPYQAQRVSAIFLRRARAGRIIEVTCNMRGFKFKPGRYVTMDLPSIGIVGQEMRVLEWEFTKKGGVKVKLRQDAKEWNDATGQLPDSGDVDIPISPSGVAQPQNFRYSVLQAGEVTHGVLAWDNVGTYAQNIVQVRKNGEIVWTAQTVEQFVRVEGLTKGSYTATVVATSYKGGVSPEAYCEFNIQAPEAPVSVEVKQGYFAITLIPHSRDLASVSTQYDFWTSGMTRLPDTSDATVTSNATRMGVGSTWTSEGLQNDKVYYWYIRTTNAFGSSQFVECAARCYTSIEDLMPQIDAEFKKTETYKELMSTLDSSIEEVENRVTELNRYMDGRVDEAFQQLGDRIGAVVTETTQKFEDVNGNITALDRKLVAAQNKFTNDLNTESGRLASLIETTNKATTDLLNKKTEALDEKLVAAKGELVEQIEGVESGYLAGDKTLDGKINTQRTELDASILSTNQATVDLLNRTSETLDQKISQTNATVSKNYTTLDGKITTAKTDLNTLIANTNKATTDLLNQKTSALSEQITSARGEISTNKQAIDALDGKLTSTKTALDATISDTNKATVDLINGTASAIRQELAVAKQEIIDDVGDVSEIRAAVATTSKAVTDLEGKVNAQWGTKIQVDSAGNKYVAGIQLGMEGSGGQVQSYFMVSANNFAVYNPGNGTATLAFAIKNNQAFLKDAFIENGTISSAKIAQEISSNNYDGNGYHKYGWYINKNGHAQFMDVWVKGNINASSGNFTGAVNATSGTFRGDVYANNGSFRGTIDATGGTFRGRVEASVIRANQFEGAIVAHRTYGDCAPVYNSQQRVCRWRWRYVDNVSGQGKNVTFFFKLNGTLASSQLNAWIAGHQILAGKKYFNDNNGMCAVGITGLGEQTIDIVIEIYTPWSTSSVTGVTISCPTVIVSRSNSSFQGPWNESHD